MEFTDHYPRQTNPNTATLIYDISVVNRPKCLFLEQGLQMGVVKGRPSAYVHLGTHDLRSSNEVAVCDTRLNKLSWRAL